MAKTKQQKAGKKNVKEVRAFEDTLKANNRIAPEGAPLPPGATHTATKGSTPKRRRYSAT